MIDGSEKRKRQLAFELQNSRVYEKRSNSKGKLKDWTCKNGSSNKKTCEPMTNIKAEDRLWSLYGKLEIYT